MSGSTIWRYVLNLFRKVTFWIILTILAALLGARVTSKPDIRIVSTTGEISLSDTLKIFVDDRLDWIDDRIGKSNDITISIEGEQLNSLKKSSNGGEKYNYFFIYSSMPSNVVKGRKRGKLKIMIEADNIFNSNRIQEEVEFYFAEAINEIKGNNKTENNKLSQHCRICSKEFYEYHGKQYVAKFSENNTLDQICCLQNGKIIFWRSIPQSPSYTVNSDTVVVIEKAIEWLARNKQEVLK